MRMCHATHVMCEISDGYMEVCIYPCCYVFEKKNDSICQLKLGVLATLDCEHWVSRVKIYDRLVRE